MKITLTDGGLIQSDGFQSGKSGWQIDYNGTAEFNDTTVRGKIYASDGEFKGSISSSMITGGIISGAEISGGMIKIGKNFSVNNNGDTTMKNANIEGYIISSETPFKPCCSLNIGYNNNSLQLYNGKNVKAINRDEKGIYSVYFKNPLKLKTHKWNSNNYIDLFVMGNCHDAFTNGFQNQMLVSINWTRNYVDNRLTINNDEAIVTYATLYFCDNNNDQLLDPVSAQIFIFATETN